MKSQSQSLLPFLRIAAGAVLSAGFGMAFAQAPAAGAGGAAVARAGSVAISQDEVTRLLQAMPDTERAAAKNDRAGIENWLRQRLSAEALLKDAQAKGWADRPEIKARLAAAVQEITARIVSTTYLDSVSQVPAGYPSDAEVAAAYEQGKSDLVVPATYRIAQIYLPAAAGDAAAVEKTRAEAKALAQQARKGDFAAIATAQSKDERSAKQGGEVGTLPLSQMLPEVRDTVAKLKVGEVSDPVQSSAGFHVLKLLETHPSRTATLDEVKPQLQAALRQQRQRQLAQAFMDGLVPPNSQVVDAAALDAALKKVN
ncbi:peptidylprolyl isomerase [Pigmentiphaga soli]|uniref:Peptidylprolyl isomerase n=1 Tax=Pigmentiphaga soli TaxID=1007095 RepID=A0ABP8GD48_9BURK